jgi:2-keto-4-pentenoate hydratase/2-oxohepta-3-ene-1,7-dioic acid hydratase in catechol pathway
MKIFVVENNFSVSQSIAEPVFSMRPETSLLRNNQNFFFPEFTKNIVCNVSLVVRISRIGRCIYKKFANRYYSEIGAGICFTATDILQKLQSENQPTDLARCFDFSLPLSPEMMLLNDIADCNNISVKLDINGKILQSHSTAQQTFSIDEIVSHISQFVSFKIGDIILVNPQQTNTKIGIGDRLQAYLADKKMLDFEVE